jgi:hypothetical protein
VPSCTKSSNAQIDSMWPAVSLNHFWGLEGIERPTASSRRRSALHRATAPRPQAIPEGSRSGRWDLGQQADPGRRALSREKTPLNVTGQVYLMASTPGSCSIRALYLAGSDYGEASWSQENHCLCEGFMGPRAYSAKRYIAGRQSAQILSYIGHANCNRLYMLVTHWRVPKSHRIDFPQQWWCF